MAIARAEEKLGLYAEVARQLRADAIRCSTAAGSGHPTSSLSAADLMAVLLAGHLRYDWKTPKNPANDHLIFSKGHASPLNYALFRAAGVVSDQEFMSFRKLGSRLEGHPTPVLPWVDVATGSLGQGLPIAVGVALAGKRVLSAPYHVWVLTGDSETAEGSIWEGLDHAGHERLANFTAIVDVNRLGQRGPTELEWNLDAYAARVRAFGCEPIVIDGHDLAAIDAAFEQTRRADGPTVVIARTLKGKGVSFLEDKENWHGKALDAEQARRALAEIGAVPSRTFPTLAPEPWQPPKWAAPRRPEWKTYREPVATRKAYGEALAALGAVRADVVVLDGEVSNSTHAEDFKQTAADRFFEMYIAEQRMVAAAVGMQVVGLMAEQGGISYLRTTREKTPILYNDRLDDFRIGGSRLVRGGRPDDAVAVIAAGITVHEAIKAADELKQTIPVRVIDAYSVKPIDAAALVDAVKSTGGRLCVVEDHWAEGGLGDAVLAALAEGGVAHQVTRFAHLAVREMPASGKPAELLDAAGISVRHIVAAVQGLR